MKKFAARLIRWQRAHGRSGLPWQGSRDPYRIWLSEVMLQQTQVAAVIAYYERFLERFPGVEALAGAGEEDVLRLWSGLGYYARARNLHAASRAIAAMGRFPATAAAIAELPGVGRSTANAIAVFAFGERAPILDGNVKRVLARAFAIPGWPGQPEVERALWATAQSLLPRRDLETYTQALMDLGATVCTKARPACGRCPIQSGCAALAQGRIDELPAPRPRKRLPLRRSTWLVLRRGGAVLLEKRPSRGLWGGLWTFPEARGADIAAYCRKSFGCEIATVRALAGLEHGFTHFRLRVRPLLCEVKRRPAPLPGRTRRRGPASNHAWLPLAEARAAAVPVPVRALIGQLAA